MVLIKQIDEIAKEDFIRSPYWMFYSGPGGEFDPQKTLIPQDHPAYNTSTPRLISANYILSTGQVLDGFLYETPPDFDRHTIFVRNTGFETWFGILPPTRDYIRCIYDMLNLKGRDMFPITWETYGKEYAGSINGFGYIENGVKTITM